MCSIMLNILALLYGAAVLTGVQAECQTTAEGYTWSFQADSDEMLLNIPSAEACLSSCFEDPNCNGYTWLTDIVVDTCYKFQVLEGQHTCNGCHSGTVPTIFHEEACKEDTSHLISVVAADSSDSCYNSCLGTNSCSAFTWYNQQTTLPFYCFLYGQCVDTIPCPGCSSGILNCIGQSSTTTSPSTTTSLLPVPLQCLPGGYNIINDPTRNENYGYNVYCDNDDTSLDWKYHNYTSPDWRGSGYYRMQAPAGNKISTSSPGEDYCGTWFPGWMNDEEGAIEQMEVGQEITVDVCFDYGNHGPTCNKPIEIKVTYCLGDFFVYYLPNTPDCNLRYCGTM